MSRLVVAAAGRLDLHELSALCRRGDELLGVGDSSFRIARGAVASLDPTGRCGDLSEVVEEWTADSDEGSQWEGVGAMRSGGRSGARNRTPRRGAGAAP